LAAGDYELARDQYKQALEFIGNRPATQAARDEAKAGMAEAFYLDAKQAMKAADVEKALPLAAQAKEYGHPQAERMIEALKRQPPKVEADTSSISHRVNEEEYKTQRDEIRRRLRRSRQYYTTAEYDKAMEECELILRDHPYEVEAMELRDRIADRMKTVSDIEFEATRSKMIRDVRASWTPERYAIDSAQRPKGSGDLTSKGPSIRWVPRRLSRSFSRSCAISSFRKSLSVRPPPLSMPWTSLSRPAGISTSPKFRSSSAA